VAQRLNLTKIHHLKLNCEGCEYHILSDPVVRQMKEQGDLGNISGELHHFHQFEPFESIPAEMVEPTMRIMCNEEFVSDNSRICESASGAKSSRFLLSYSVSLKGVGWVKNRDHATQCNLSDIVVGVGSCRAVCCLARSVNAEKTGHCANHAKKKSLTAPSLQSNSCHCLSQSLLERY
jgi:hypothetical protein